MHSNRTTFDVLVVGAGPSGLTTAASLARAGASVLVVEKHGGTSVFPKATGIRPRTMEVLRSWGLEERVREEEQPVRPAVAVSATLADVPQEESLGIPSPEVMRTLSPGTVVFCPQDHLERVLLEHTESRGGEVRFGTALVGFDMDEDGVTARLRAHGRAATYAVRARFLVGADGADSAVRRGLGIRVEHLGSEGDHLAVLFRADLASVLAGRRYALHWVTAPGAEGLFVPSGNDGRWVFDRDLHAGPGESVRDWPPQRCAETIRVAAGVPDLDLEVLRVFPWSFGAEVATAQRSGNAFLVGDAAHRTTPRGATGMNTGIADAHNLGWKLGWVLRGWAGEGLLDSYEAERRPVGLHNALRSLEGRDRDGDELSEDFGVVYRSDVVIPDTSAGSSPGDAGRGARPGARAPHAEVDVQGRRISTLDLFDGRLTLLTGGRTTAWDRAAHELVATGLPIAALGIGRDLPDPDGTLARLFGIGDTGAVLVRPDGHVAWRQTAEGPDSHGELHRAIGITLGRTTPVSARGLAS